MPFCYENRTSSHAVRRDMPSMCKGNRHYLAVECAHIGGIPYDRLDIPPFRLERVRWSNADRRVLAKSRPSFWRVATEVPNDISNGHAYLRACDERALAIVPRCRLCADCSAYSTNSV